MQLDLKTIKKVYINLDSATKNKQNIEFDFVNLGYSNYERFPAVYAKKTRGWSEGCTRSHNLAMQKYKENIPLLLMEDDCKSSCWYSEYVKDGILTIPDDADAIYLGYSTAWHSKYFKANSIDDKWMRLEGALATHAILFLNNTIDFFIENSEKTLNKKYPLDCGYAEDVLPKIKVYAPKKVIFFQNNECSRTTNVIVDPEKNNWISHKANGVIDFSREIR